MILKRIISGALLASAAALALATVPEPAAAGQNWCPPGLAKKGCIPPGQRKKWYPGDYIPREIDYRRVYYDDYRLPRPQPGYFYADVGGDVYLLAEATRRVIEAVNLVNAASQ